MVAFHCAGRPLFDGFIFANTKQTRQIAREIMLLLLIMYMKKNITEVKTDELSKRARAICNLHSCYSFALVLHKNAFVFSQLEAQVDYYTENTENVHYARPG